MCVCLCIHVCAQERVRDRMRERERGLVSSAKTSLDSSGSFCPVLFIKLVVLRLSAHTHGLSRLSCGSSMVAFVSLTRPFFFLAGRVHVLDISC